MKIDGSLYSCSVHGTWLIPLHWDLLPGLVLQPQDFPAASSPDWFLTQVRSDFQGLY